MAVVRNVTGTYNILTENFACSVDLSGCQYCAVGQELTATGKMRAALVTGQGARAVGIQQNAPVFANTNELSELMTEGITKVKAYTTFTAGVELTPHDTLGELEAAGSGDYVVAIAREAAKCANAIVVAKLVNPYQKN